MAKQLIRRQALDEFGKLYVKTLRDELLNNKPFPKRASGRLVNSINYKLINTPQGTNLQLLAENYLTFVDKGVSGTEKKYATPYSYRTKYPPIQEIKRWVRLKGIPDEAAYPIQKKIFRFGMKPTNVINKTIRFIEYRSKWKTKFEGEIADEIVQQIKSLFNQ
jgi:hypothetical protein